MNYNLSLALLYATFLKELVQTEADLHKILSRNSSNIDLNSWEINCLYPLLNLNTTDDEYAARANASLKALGLLTTKPLETYCALNLTLWELEFYRTISSCSLGLDGLTYTRSGLVNFISLDELNELPDRNQVLLAHGLRWGWQVLEKRGLSLSLKIAYKEYNVSNGCSCKQANCFHKQYISMIFACRKEYGHLTTVLNTSK